MGFKSRKTINKPVATKTAKAPKVKAETGKNKTTLIVIPRPKVSIIKVEVKGLSPLLMKAWSPEAIGKIEAKQGKKAPKNTQLPPRDIQKEWNSGRYINDKGYDCAKGVHFAKAIAAAALLVDGIPKAYVDKTVYITEEFIPLTFDDAADKRKKKPPRRARKPSTPHLNRTMGKIGSFPNKVAYPIYRPEYRNWSCSFHVEYDETVLSAEQVIALLDRGGFYNGIGEWRPERSGSFGRFQVVKAGHGR